MFINPPYGRDIKNWVKKAHDESKNGATCVMLIPARTDTSYWHDYIFDKAEIRFMRGRIKFQKQDMTFGDSAPFPTAIIIFRSNRK